MNNVIKRALGFVGLVSLIAFCAMSLHADGYQVVHDAYKKLGINGADITKHIQQVQGAVKTLEEIAEAGDLTVEMVCGAVMSGLTFTKSLNHEKRKKLTRAITRHAERLLEARSLVTCKNMVVEILCARLEALHGQVLRDKAYVRDARPQRQRTRWEFKAYTGTSYEKTRFGATACGDDSEDVIRQELSDDDDERFFSEADPDIVRLYTTPSHRSWSMGDLFDIAGFQ
ncbi:hypothetical protein K2W90_00510 [Candidatus Babeliales bacterium]|nr:hypothetical protein [Candidatus Babeliales bacterium]